jgi:hypothetical protein
VSSGEVELAVGEAVFSIHRYTAPPRFSVTKASSSIPYPAWLLMVTHASPGGVLALSFDFSGKCEPCEAGDIDGVRAIQSGVDRMFDSVAVNWRFHGHPEEQPTGTRRGQ